MTAHDLLNTCLKVLQKQISRADFEKLCRKNPEWESLDGLQRTYILDAWEAAAFEVRERDLPL